MLYQYTATDQDSTVVHGSIDAPTLDQARQILIDRGMEVTEIREPSRSHSHQDGEPPQPALKTTFAFEGTDPQGVIRRGSVQAESKYQAYEQLRESQFLHLNMLSPVGITPQYHDRDLESWQNRGKKSSMHSTAQIPSSPIPAKTAPKTIGFSNISPSTNTIVTDLKPVLPQTSDSTYTSMLSTLRLYAGWLLSWYAVFVAFGYYTHSRSLSFTIPFVEAFYLSSLMYSITVATFLFLMLSSVQRKLHGGLITGIVLFLVGVTAFLGIQGYMPA